MPDTVETPGTAGPVSLRSIAHRLAGDAVALPVEGHLASFDGRDRLAQLRAADAGRAARTGRPRRLLDVHVRQLAADAALRPGLGREVRGRRPDGRRRPHARVRVRARRRQRRSRSRARFGVDYPIAIDSDYGVWRAFANHFWPAVYLADARGPDPLPPLRRGRVRDDRDGRSSSCCVEAGATGVDQELVDGRAARPRGRRRLADAAVTRDVPRVRPEHRLRLRRTSPLRPSRTPTPRRGRLPLNYWALAGAWTVARHAAVADEPGGADRVPVPGPRRQPRDGTRDQGRLHPVPGLPRRPAGRRTRTGRMWPPTARGAVDEQRTYQLIRQPGPIAERTFEIEFLDAGVEAYCFTFG